MALEAQGLFYHLQILFTFPGQSTKFKTAIDSNLLTLSKTKNFNYSRVGYSDRENFLLKEIAPNPGPNAFKVDKFKVMDSAPSFGFGTARRHDPVRQIVKKVVPGPGKYKERSYTADGRSYR